MPASGQRATLFGDALADYAKLSFPFSGYCLALAATPLPSHFITGLAAAQKSSQNCAGARWRSNCASSLRWKASCRSPTVHTLHAREMLAELSHHLLSSLHDETLLRRVFNLRQTLCFAVALPVLQCVSLCVFYSLQHS